jgi:MFS family permease
VFGWATGGVIGGIVADYIGRKRTMLLAILAYSLTTGLSAFAWDWVSFAVLRFLVGVGDRFGMGDRRLYRFRGVAGPRARQRRRAAAVRSRAGQHYRLIGLAGDHVGQFGGLVGDSGPQRLALPLSDRRIAGLGGIVDSAKHP